MLEDENPGLIYEAEDGPDPLNISHVPLVLIHDGGGTCFSYYCLDPIGRPTYEIHNPRYYTQQPWEGGIPEIAQHYVSLIHKRVPHGRILLGGWSFGGVLSLAISRLLADDPLYNVLGIVMIDSICPSSVRSKDWSRGIIYKGQFSERTSQETIDRVTWCFSDAVRVIAEWQMPSWDDSEDANNINNGLRNGGQTTNGGRSHSLATTKALCPPTILLRAVDFVPVDTDYPSRVDLVRYDRSLGWNNYRKGFHQEIVDVPGHHFSIFAFDNIEAITEKLMAACNKLEKQSAARKPSHVP